MNIREKLDNEIRLYGQLKFSIPTICCRKSRNVPYEKPYSAKKPRYCHVKVEYCLDCTESECTYRRAF